MADYSLGTAHGVIKITADTAGAAQAEQAVKQVGTSADGTSQALQTVGNVMLVAGAAVGGGLALAANSAIGFEQSLSAIQAVSGSTESQMNLISDAALRIGQDTSFGAQDAAFAMEELIKAGVSVEDTLNGAADATVSLAAATSIDLTTAATIASQAMNLFGIAGTDAAHIADVVSQAAGASAIGAEDFAQSMNQAGGVAKLAGLSFEDTAIAIAEMGQAGYTGSDAGTSLKTAFLNLQPTTQAQIAAFKELGIITADGTNKLYDQTGALLPLKDIQQVIQDGTNGMSEAQKTMALQTAFGSDAIRAAAVFAGEGAAGYDDMTKAMEGTGTAAEQAATRQDNAAGSLEQLKGSVETLAIQIGNALLPVIKTITNALTGFLNKLGGLSPEMQKVIAFVALGVASFLLLGGAIIKVVGFFQRMSAALTVLKNATIAQTIVTKLAAAATKAWSIIQAAFNAIMALNPFVLILIALAALVVAIIYAYTHFQTFRDIVDAVWAWIKNAVVVAIEFIKNFLVTGWNNIVAAAQVAWDFLKSIISTSWEFIKQLVVNAFTAIIGFFVGGWNNAKQLVTDAWNFIGNTIQAAWDRVKQLVADGFNAVVGFFVSGWNNAKQIVTDAWNSIKTSVQTGIGNVISYVSEIPGKITGAIGNLGSLLFNTGADIMNGLWNGIKDVWNSVSGWLSDVGGWIVDLKGPPSKDKTLLEENGALIIGGLLRGLEREWPAVERYLSGLGDKMVPLTANLGAGGGFSTKGATLRAAARGVAKRFPGAYDRLSGRIDEARANGVDPSRIRSAAAGATYNFVTNNPIAEKASDSNARRLRAVAALGAFG